MNTSVERRAHVFAAAAAVNFLTVCAIVAALLTVVAVLVVTIFAPDQLLVVVPTVIGLMVPLIQGLMAAAQKKTTEVTNGQIGQIIKLTQEAKKAEGIVEGIEKGVEMKTNDAA